MIEGLREAAFFACGRPLKGPSSASRGSLRYRTDPAHPKPVISCASDSNPVVALSPGVSGCIVFDGFGYDRGVIRAG